MYNCKWFRAMCAKPVEWGTFHIQVKLRKENSHRRCSHCPISWTTKLFWSLRSIIMWLCIVHACSVLSGKVSPSRILELDSRNELLSYILEKTHIYIYTYTVTVVFWALGLKFWPISFWPKSRKRYGISAETQNLSNVWLAWQAWDPQRAKTSKKMQKGEIRQYPRHAQLCQIHDVTTWSKEV